MKSISVMLVDDEKEFVDTLAERLELRGIGVRVANDGETALPMIDDDPPDLVFLDMMMPGIGGLETLKRIKERHPAVQVILLTGRGSDQDGMDGMNMGAADYIMKPIEIDQLMEKLEKFNK